jgi:alpha-N-arabinofuranosidase
MADLRAKNGSEKPWKVDYFGVGNENWGCGGNMTPEYYANEYRRYQTYVRNYDEKKKINKICCGANVDDYHWTEGVLKTCFDHTPKNLHGFMDLLSLHYYVVPETWEDKGSALEFNEEGWYKTMNKALYMDTLIRGHAAIMDQYDPEKTIGMSVDEWGAWYNTEPGTNPGFLYQQNTVRDALIAGITLNIFNKHCDRVKMANLAQMVNVLQAVLLTEGEQMIKTPTYHVMHMYRHHQGAALLDSSLTGVDAIGPDEWVVPKVTESVSENEQGVITITLNNLSIEEVEKVDVQFARSGYQVVEARVVSDTDMHAHNTFTDPEVVSEKEFTGYELTEKGMVITLPCNSVVEIRVAR